MRIILIVFDALIQNNLFSQEDKPLDNEEEERKREEMIDKLPEILPERILAKDGEREKDPPGLMERSFGTARAVIWNENINEVRNKIIRTEERLEKLTKLGLEALKV
jgi:hypothetical protein